MCTRLPSPFPKEVDTVHQQAVKVVELVKLVQVVASLPVQELVQEPVQESVQELEEVAPASIAVEVEAVELQWLFDHNGRGRGGTGWDWGSRRQRRWVWEIWEVEEVEGPFVWPVVFVGPNLEEP